MEAEWTLYVSITDPDRSVPDPIDHEPTACKEFREGFPEEYASRMGKTITGTFTLHDDDIGSILGGYCSGSGGYDDIAAGLDVVVRNSQGRIIAASELWSGLLVDRSECTLPFRIVNIPDADFYEVEVGRRGGLVYSLAELKRRDWHIGFEMGR